MTVIFMDSSHALFVYSLQIKYTAKVAHEGATDRESIPSPTIQSDISLSGYAEYGIQLFDYFLLKVYNVPPK